MLGDTKHGDQSNILHKIKFHAQKRWLDKDHNRGR